MTPVNVYGVMDTLSWGASTVAGRAIVLLLVVALVAAGWVALRWLLAWRFRHLAATSSSDGLEGLLSSSNRKTPALLYFTTDDCAQCRFQQTPILDRLAQVASLPIVKINAIESQELARSYGILTVPSTVLLDARRKPVAINHGLAHFEKLRLQVGALHSLE